jgi:vanillate O-demethylase ferredoxin subunit
MSDLNVVVVGKTAEAQDICLLDLAAADGSALPAFSAGSHVDVHLPGGLVRQYSLCNDPAEPHRYQLGVLRDAASRGGSAAVHDALQVGQALRISAPKNHFGLAAGAHRHLLLAGGIGITPLLCMAERLARIGADFALHHCTRTAARTPFMPRLRASGFADRVHWHFDDGDAAQKIDLQALLGRPQDGTHVYVCGPQGFMDAVLGTARSAGWPGAQLHSEAFGAAPVQHDRDAAFEVQLASSGRVVQVAAGQTVLRALADAGVEVMSSCEQGVCGTCLTRVISGTPDHRDQYLLPGEQAAGDQFLPCCSRAKSPRLVLDL